MTVKITFVPEWAAKVVRARGAAFTDSLAALSQHDLRHFRLAQHLFKAKLLQLGFTKDEFICAAEDWKDEYTEADALFAIYGMAKDKRDLGAWDLSHYEIITEPGVGYTVVECASAPAGNFLYDHVHQLSKLEYMGCPYASSAYKILLAAHADKCMAVSS